MDGHNNMYNLIYKNNSVVLCNYSSSFAKTEALTTFRSNRLRKVNKKALAFFPPQRRGMQHKDTQKGHTTEERISNTYISAPAHTHTHTLSNGANGLIVRRYDNQYTRTHSTNIRRHRTHAHTFKNNAYITCAQAI